MTKVGAYEAKTHLPQLLERVQKGERIVITKHGHPVAELVPVDDHTPETVKAALSQLRAFQQTHTLGNLSIKELIEEGRKH